MAKVFTITEGLENLGAMKTGGQGSVYKGRRVGEIITAVKLLPTPIYSESEDDKNFRDFRNEVLKLKRVNEKPNPNVVKILSSGLSETGNFPLIEMEYIEGPDLEELLKPPHDPVFTIKEVIKVAEQLSNALAHCHSLDVKHGDIKSNNVKFNIHTGNYVLLDFGLAIMSDEQRRTSLRHAGAVEFMAPEQNEGQMLFQTDVYSFGIILFELLAGRVPFPLEGQSEMARNNVRLAHMEKLPPDVVSLRKEALPDIWQQDKQIREANIPEWLAATIYKCLRKKPEHRFANGAELQDFIIHNSVHTLDNKQTELFQHDYAKHEKEKDELQRQVSDFRQQLTAKEREMKELRALVRSKDNSQSVTRSSEKNGVSKTAFGALLFFTIGFGAFSAYNVWQNHKSLSNSAINAPDTTVAANIPVRKKISEKKQNVAQKKEIPKDSLDSIRSFTRNADKQVAVAENQNGVRKDSAGAKPPPQLSLANASHQYMVTSKAYFYNTPDESTRRNAFVVPSNNAIVNALDEQNDFVYVVFTNQLGQRSKGWLRKRDLQPLNE